MESLEDALRRVHECRDGLTATKIIKEVYSTNEPHTFSEQVCDGWSVGIRTEERIEYRTVTFDPVYGPDTVKREYNGKRLQETLDSDDWYSARYEAGVALKIDWLDMEDKLGDWLADLDKRRKVTEPNQVQEKVGEGEEFRGSRGGYYVTVPIYRSKTIQVLTDDANRAEKDLRMLYKIGKARKLRKSIANLLSIEENDFLTDEMNEGHELKDWELKLLYHTSNKHEVVKKAGEKLGKYRITIFAHQHPVITAIAIGTITAGIIYSKNLF